jgi:hypothetical protein
MKRSYEAHALRAACGTERVCCGAHALPVLERMRARYGAHARCGTLARNAADACYGAHAAYWADALYGVPALGGACVMKRSGECECALWQAVRVRVLGRMRVAGTCILGGPKAKCFSTYLLTSPASVGR